MLLKNVQGLGTSSPNDHSVMERVECDVMTTNLILTEANAVCIIAPQEPLYF